MGWTTKPLLQATEQLTVAGGQENQVRQDLAAPISAFVFVGFAPA